MYYIILSVTAEIMFWSSLRLGGKFLKMTIEEGKNGGEGERDEGDMVK
jgi:hypothetical protein